MTMIDDSSNINEVNQLRRELQKLKQSKQKLEIQLAEITQENETLENRLSLLQLVVDNIPSLIFWKDCNSVFQGCNRPWATAAGFEHPDEIIGKTDYDLYPTDVNVEHYIEKDRHVLNRGETEYHIEYKPHRDVWYDTRKIPIRDVNGNIVGLLATIENITQRKKAEEALRIAEEKYRGIFENALEGIFQSTPNGKFISVNPAMSKIYGYDSPEEFIKGITDISRQIYVDSEARKMFENLMERDQEVKGLQYRSYRRDGSIIWVEENTRVVQNEQGNILYYEGIIQDISERKKIENFLKDNSRMLEEKIAERTQELQQEIRERQHKEEALEEAKKAAEEANKAKSRFIANMSHELRTPLNAIIGFAQLLRRDQDFNEEQKQQLEIINRSGEHLLSLINSILDLSKIEVGKITLNPTVFDLHYLLQDLQSLFSLKADNKGIYLNCILDSDLPQFVEADEGKLRQILINLLGNALKFTRQGGVTVRALKNQVNSPVIPNTDSVCFEIEDTGMGIENNELEKIFLAFEQTLSGRTLQEGTGLGLAITHKFIQLMGGDIEVTSQLNQGSCFRVILPLKIADSDTLVTRPSYAKVIGLAPNQETFRILIVDDTIESCLLLKKLLLKIGFEVKEAQNGQQGLEIWQEWQPHLIWMDMRMPLMDGYTATRQIKSTPQGQNTIIIALTASAFEEEKQAILAAGCDDFVRKPFVESTIFEVMNQFLGVEYLYEDSSSSSLTNFNNALKAEEISLQDVLSVMSEQWQTELQEMAMQLNRKKVLKLIEQIPSDYETVKNYLKTLANNYQFSQIVDQINNEDET